MLLFCFAAPNGFSQTKCINTSGEAAIVNQDVPSAKLEAVARANGSHEQVVGTEVKAGSFVQNFTLVDDVIKTKQAVWSRVIKSSVKILKMTS